MFVSYAHDSEDHKRQVLWFCRFLHDECGIEVHLDTSYEGDRRDWSVWAMNQLRMADFVIVVASPEFKRRAEGQAAHDEGRGSQFEASILRDLLVGDRNVWTRKILPVVLPGRSIEEIPTFLLPHNADHYVISNFTKPGVDRLLRAMTGQSHAPEPTNLPRHSGTDGASGTGPTDGPQRRTPSAGGVYQKASGHGHSSIQQAAGNINNYYGKRHSRRLKAVIFVALGVVALVATIWALLPQENPSGEEPAWREVLSRNDYALTPEKFSCITGVEDKVDLDTGLRGHGAKPQIPGCEADGGLADLIIDQELHTSSENRRTLLRVSQGTDLTATACDSMINNPAAKPTSSIPLADLRVGDLLCVRTDKERIARVTFTRIRTASSPGVVINLVVWEKTR